MYVAIIVANAAHAVHLVCGSNAPSTGTQKASTSIAMHAMSSSVEYWSWANAERATIDQMGPRPCIVRRLSTECVMPSHVRPPRLFTDLARAQSSMIALRNEANSSLDVSTSTHPPAAAAINRFREFDNRNGYSSLKK